ncbi:MAG TPA: UPF0182 family protein, partial [bacterium]|nr:UPF0182 family protein [bacterium]
MRRLSTILFVLILGYYAVSSYVSFYSELLWFQSMGYEEAFWRMYMTEYIVGAVYFAIFWLVIGVNIWIASRMEAVYVSTTGGVYQQPFNLVAKPAKTIFFGILIFVSYIMSSAPAAKWMRILQYMHSESFGTADSVFQKDIGYYIYQLPFYQSIVSWSYGVVIVAMIAVLATYLYRKAIYIEPQGIRLADVVKRHLMILGAMLLLIYAVDNYFSAYNILYKDNGTVVGASYTDVHAVLLGYRVMIAVAILGAIAVLWGAVQATWRFAVIGGVAQFAVGFVMLNVYPGLIHRFVVTPNALEKEKPYIEENIRQTRRAYELDKITEQDFNYELSLKASDLKANSSTIKNITLWDYRPIKDSYSQLQEIRPYYNFYDVDIDRYMINGEYRQVMLAGREMNLDKIGSSENWINKTFIYTHGHGIVMSPVNVVTQEGQPEFFIKNIPPELAVNIKIDRPEIYFGELMNESDYVIVKTSKEEFDYPLGESNQHTMYKEESGVSIGSFARKMLFAIRFNKFNLLLNDYIQAQSKVLYYRNIRDRVEKIAPYIRWDRDPYLVAENGRLYWMMDGYTITDQYPYSAMSEERVGSGAFARKRYFNYIRNSVKVVIDAYNGKTDLYAFQPDSDPLIRVYGKMFKGVFKEYATMPDELKKHVRYPQDLFDIQASHFASYHVSDANVFFNKEDVWNVAQEKYGDDVQTMESYYMIMRLPGETKEEFITLLPFTPNNKSNMIAWFCVRSDGDNYGKLLVYRFPKTELVYGPMQVESRIDQTPEISEKLTLWNQQGSRVTRGNMLVVPINNSLLYVEPLYLQSNQSRLPELKKVIVAYGNSIFMEDNLEIGLEKIFGG